jgi:hypothetical protein
VRRLRNTSDANRWLCTFGALLALSSLSVAGALTLTAWLLLPAILLVPVWPAAMAWLALGSDANAAASVHELPARGDDAERRAA